MASGSEIVAAEGLRAHLQVVIRRVAPRGLNRRLNGACDGGEGDRMRKLEEAPVTLFSVSYGLALSAQSSLRVFLLSFRP